VEPCISHEYLVVEGHLAGLLLRDLFEPRAGETMWAPRWKKCVYMDVDEDECLRRRLVRDTERGRTDIEILTQHLLFTRPARRMYVEKQLSFATDVV
jgi:uridine kinase